MTADLTSDSIRALLDSDTDGVHIKAWSYTRLENFEKCKFRAKLLYLDKIPEPQRPLKPGQTEQANDRGTRIHLAAEAFVRGGVELIAELSKFRPEFERLRELFAEGKVSLEGEWAFNEAWEPCGFFSDDVWARIKLDAAVMLEPAHAAVIDYKSGRKNGNEVKHADQMSLYQLATFLRNPELERVTVELWYVDQDDLTRQTYTREQGLRYLKNFNKRGLALTVCEEFPPNPNQYTCRFCQYGPKGSSICKVGL